VKMAVYQLVLRESSLLAVRISAMVYILANLLRDQFATMSLYYLVHLVCVPGWENN
jgi:hypothetical protein